MNKNNINQTLLALIALSVVLIIIVFIYNTVNRLISPTPSNNPSVLNNQNSNINNSNTSSLDANLPIPFQQPQSQAASQQPQPTLKPIGLVGDITKVKIEGQPFTGNVDAPVVIALWVDYQCPFCKSTEVVVIPQIIKDYVKTGKVKIVFKDYQFLGNDSMTAALAARAVWEVAPDKFYDWHKAIFDKQDSENSGWGSKANILALTKSLGISSTKVDELMTSKEKDYKIAIVADRVEGRGFSIKGTPAAIIGKRLLVGDEPYSVFKSAIEEVLDNK